MPLGRAFVHVYTGDGKGKTTAAFGLACRAGGHGLRSYVAQFLKAVPYGEVLLLRERCGDLITVEQFGRPGHVSGPSPEDVALARRGLAAAKRAMLSGAYDLVILDEVNVALFYRLLSPEEVLDFLNVRPAHVEVVLTGRYAPPEILGAADLITEMREVLHYYADKGVQARDGIER